MNSLCKKNKNYCAVSKKGFTLIELVIVILIMSALGIMTTSYIRNSVDIYTNITTLDKSLGSVRFTPDPRYSALSMSSLLAKKS